jgi:FtsH-binding integral membrane protein
MATAGIFAKRDTSAITYDAVRPLIKWTYAWMFVGLAITSVIAVVTDVESVLINNPGLMWIALIAEFALVFALSIAINRLSPTVAALMFVVYAALNGFTLSLIVQSYTGASVAAAFVSTAAIFGAMSVFAFTTKVDLLQYRTYFFVGLIGLLVAMVINIFLRSDAFTTLISIAGVLVFTALTAYDTQKLKYLAASPEFQADGTAVSRFSIIMALQLYLDFINIFLFLLQLFGRGSRD